MWYEVRAFGAKDWCGDAAEHGGWALAVRTNCLAEAENALSILREEFEEDDLDWNWE